MNDNLLIIKKWINWAILFIGILGSFMHFLYNLTNQSFIVGFISPVNESVWEHLKLSFFPTLFWWIISYIVLSKKITINLDKWIFAGTIGLIVGMIFIISFHYVTTKGFNLEYTILDVFSLFFGVVITQTLGYHLYKYADVNKLSLFIALLMFITLFALIIVFTIKPPHLPIFLDSSKNTYGINKV